MNRLLVATGNAGKVKELTALLHGSAIELLSLKDFSQLPAVVEDGETFEANAIKKARSACEATGLPVIADDSGLVVDAIDGMPGVYSARYAGEGCSDDDNNAKLLHELAGVGMAQRTAAFHCVIALCLPDGLCTTFSGHLDGRIIDQPVGGGGFGYDPLFLVPEYGKTLAELPLEVKNRISHRGRAFAALRHYLLESNAIV